MCTRIFWSPFLMIALEFPWWCGFPHSIWLFRWRVLIFTIIHEEVSRHYNQSSCSLNLKKMNSNRHQSSILYTEDIHFYRRHSSSFRLSWRAWAREGESVDWKGWVSVYKKRVNWSCLLSFSEFRSVRRVKSLEVVCCSRLLFKLGI